MTTNFISNTPTPATNTDVGINVSKPGFNALSTSGSNLVYSSSWPTAQYPFETTVDNPGNLNSVTLTIAHNLGYPPLAFAWFYGPDISGIGNTSFRMAFAVDDTNIYINTFSSSFTTDQINFMLNSTQIDVKALNVDISVDVDYSLQARASFNTPYDPNYGIKIAKPGKSSNSQDIRDFVLHSKCQSPLILAVKTQKTSNAQNPNVVQYVSNLTYPSWVYGFIKIGPNFASVAGLPVDSFVPAPYYSQAYPETITDGITSYIQFSSSPPDQGASLVILRDPMFAPTITDAQY